MMRIVGFINDVSFCFQFRQLALVRMKKKKEINDNI